jgi:hypothetical protein
MRKFRIWGWRVVSPAEKSSKFSVYWKSCVTYRKFANEHTNFVLYSLIEQAQSWCIWRQTHSASLNRIDLHRKSDLENHCYESKQFPCVMTTWEVMNGREKNGIFCDQSPIHHFLTSNPKNNLSQSLWNSFWGSKSRGLDLFNFYDIEPLETLYIGSIINSFRIPQYHIEDIYQKSWSFISEIETVCTLPFLYFVSPFYTTKDRGK